MGELGELAGKGASHVSENDVLKSFMNSVNPNEENPWMLRYIQLGQLMLVLGDILFVHGAVSESALGYVPGKGDSNRCKDLLTWCTELNAWAGSELSNYTSAYDSPNSDQPRA